MYNVLITTFVIAYSTVVAILQPYRSPVINAFHVLHLQKLTLFSVALLGAPSENLHRSN